MPNWCFNTLVVTGPDTDVRSFQRVAKLAADDQRLPFGTDLSLGKSYPLPEGEDWYTWCNRRWGTKWNVEAKLEKAAAGHLVYRFESVWAPPVRWLEHVSRKYPSLRFRLEFEEGGQGIAGIVSVKHGAVAEMDQAEH